jgi:hypothetical protein
LEEPGIPVSKKARKNNSSTGKRLNPSRAATVRWSSTDLTEVAALATPLRDTKLLTLLRATVFIS